MFFILQSLWASFLEFITIFTVFPSLKSLPSFLRLFRLPSNVFPPHCLQMYSMFTHSPSISSSFTCSLALSLLYSSHYKVTTAMWLANLIHTFFSFLVFTFLNLSAVLNSSSLLFCLSWKSLPSLYQESIFSWNSRYFSYCSFLCPFYGLSFHSLPFQCLIHGSWLFSVYSPQVFFILSKHHLNIDDPEYAYTTYNLFKLHIHTSNHGYIPPLECLMDPWDVLPKTKISLALSNLFLLWSPPSSSPNIKIWGHPCLLPLSHVCE